MDEQKVKKIFRYQGKMNWLKSYHKKRRDRMLREKIQAPKHHH
tara:strand:- start:255 stop:383 length:129 start_codon:yes stop_codon:yes gene_type:complete